MTPAERDRRIDALEREVAALPTAELSVLEWCTNDELDQLEALYHAAEQEERDLTAAEEMQITGIAYLAEARRLAGEPTYVEKRRAEGPPPSRWGPVR